MSRSPSEIENAAHAAPLSSCQPGQGRQQQHVSAVGAVTGTTIDPRSSPVNGHRDSVPVPLPPISLGPPAAGEGEGAGIPEPNNNASPIPSAVDPASNKRPRPPVTSIRPNGPSLLTQALASARGIPPVAASAAPAAHVVDPRRLEQKPHGSPAPVPVSAHSSRLPPDTRAATVARDVQHHNGLASRSDGVPLTTTTTTPARGTWLDEGAVPSDISTTPTSSSSTDLSVSPTSLIDAGFALSTPFEMPGRTSRHSSTFQDRRDLLSSPKGRPRSLERTEKEIKTHQLDANGAHSVNVGSTLLSRGDLALGDPVSEMDNPQDPRVQYRQWRAERTVNVGPEKVWSIGKGDLAGTSPGQVEQSITEALAGMEPTRSRKASHSLRFFKEGLPEEKGRRKDTKRRDDQPPPKEQRDAPAQSLSRAGTFPLVPSPRRVRDIIDLPVDQLPPPFYTPAGSAVESPTEEKKHEDDYFGLDAQPKELSDGARQLQPVRALGPGQSSDPETSQTVSPSSDGFPVGSVLDGPRRKSGDGTENGESPEDGEDSGEEKISSAVFVPHQEAPEVVCPDATKICRPAPVQRQPTVKKPSPWLVKADEPEADNDSVCQETGEITPPASERQLDDDNLSQTGDEHAVEDDVGPVENLEPVPGDLSRPVSQYYDEHVHDHQLAPKKPLDAIELIPYKHQVGGHTTLWRFSKRAVCKQLNNSENKFYENIERYHRGLLPFLPRLENPLPSGLISHYSPPFSASHLR